MACQWQDEQTGGHCPTLAKAMLNGPNSDKKWFTFTNGTHTDSLKPETAPRLISFMEIYVNGSGPAAKAPIFLAGVPLLYQVAMGISGVPPPLPPDPILLNPDYNSAKAAFEAQKPVRIEFENGDGRRNPGTPIRGSAAPTTPSRRPGRPGAPGSSVTTGR